MKIILLLAEIFLIFFKKLRLKKRIFYFGFIFLVLPFQSFLEVYSIALLASVLTNQKLNFTFTPQIFTAQIFDLIFILSLVTIFLYFLRRKNLDFLHKIASEATFFWQEFALKNMVNYGREDRFTEKFSYQDKYLKLNKDLNNILQNELLALYKDVFFPFLKIISNTFILLSVIVYCISQSGVFFLPFITFSIIYYLIFYAYRNKKTKDFSNKFIESQSNNNDIVRYLFSNINSFIYSKINNLLVFKSKSEFKNTINNYFKLSSTLLIVLFQLELIFGILVSLVILLNYLNNNIFTPSDILIALIGLQKTLRTSQQISNSYSLFSNNSKTIITLYSLIKKCYGFINYPIKEKKDENISINIGENITFLKGKINIDFLNNPSKKIIKNKKNIFNFSFSSKRPTHLKAPSGYGKTLLLKKIFEMPIELERKKIAEIDGYLQNKKEIILKDIIFYLPQSPQLPPFNIQEFFQPFQKDMLYHLLKEFNFSGKVIKKIMSNKLDEKYSNPIDNLSLSGGEIQRLWIIKAILIKPLILILDEPFSALDLELVNQISEKIPKLLPTKSILVLTSHIELSNTYKKIIL